MTDVNNMIKSVKLSWLSRLQFEYDSPWKKYFRLKIKRFGGGKLFLNCNYDLAISELYNCSE